MASISLPRVLQQRKTSLDLQREHFEKFQSIAISKAVNPTETPVKEKHVRSAIIGTYQEKSGTVFWTFVLRQPLQDNRIVAWKFCHVLHKVLREGHPRVIHDSQRHKKKLEDLGKLWQHLREGYGKLIQLYIRLLITKLEFHNRNPGLPGNLQVTTEELEAIGENDINIYFQMSVEMFDYMDDILNLQRAVFGSLDLSRSNSMTPCGQCRLAPLIPCIQDASQLYDYCVKILFKLHGALPADTLLGHRDRFSKQFHDLKTFYNTIKHMQYFKHLITIPGLPDKPPNFLIQSELRTYVTPVVVLPQEDPIDNESTVDSLIDTSDTTSISDQFDSAGNGTISPESRHEREHYYAQEAMIQENERQREELQFLVREHQRLVEEMKQHMRKVDPEMALKDQELMKQRHLNDALGKQSAELIVKVNELEEKNRLLDEKFQKLKEVYSKLREEHINLIRKKAEVDKLLGSTRLTLEQSERRTQEVNLRMEELLQGQVTATQEAERVSQARAELIEVQRQFDMLKNENIALLAKIEFISSEKSVAEGDLHDLLSQKEELDTRISELTSDIERTRIQLKKDSDSALIELILNSISSAEQLLLTTSITIESPSISALTCTPDYLETQRPSALQSLSDVERSYKIYQEKSTEGKQLIKSTLNFAYYLSLYLIHAKSTSNTSTDITIDDKLTDECKKLSSASISLLQMIKAKSEGTEEQFKLIRDQLEVISALANGLSKARGDVERIGDMVESELQGMDKAIEEAASKIQEMLTKSRAGDSGLKLEVNEKILDSCTALMSCIRKLVKKSRLLQTEIVAQGKGTASAKEFYKRNHQWSEGLISAAKAIGLGAKFLLEAADKVVGGDGKFEQLVVASQGIAASTAQLVVASRVKAERNSSNLGELTQASREVTQATAGVVATAKSCSQMVEESEDLGLEGLSLHQAKRLEMEAQVRVLELEQALETERLKLAALRRRHYQLAGDV
ncbi:huntingtin-interacting protein 1 isoform X1 [Fopius arisanus]|uniref:Huntingtin-interacting protein 1 isoform X1 n=1 Tax=Fopius arisanus TaxID=64838 RepID=A0A9R1TDT9_9HYME|nr:PREDICTED: huntingtin-interacting protein 1-like isoform X1 [Fopius arisanus]